MQKGDYSGRCVPNHVSYHVISYQCGKNGHITRTWPENRKDGMNVTTYFPEQEVEGDALVVSNDEEVKEQEWVIDSACSHMSQHKDWFGS